MNEQDLTTEGIELTMLPSRVMVPPRAGRAHALKNCLAIASAVNEVVASELSELSRRRLARSQKALRRIAELIDEDLAVDGDSRQEPWEFVRAEQLFEAVRVRMEDFAESKRVRLEFLAGRGGLWGDRESLTEALGNIVKNAVEWSSAGDTVRAVSEEGADCGQLWTVRDAGPGISHQVLAQLGTPFRSSREGGSGLGIAVTREIIQNHGGLLHVESAPGWGTMVSIWVPLVAGA
jgi:signal transduction histidine kinase